MKKAFILAALFIYPAWAAGDEIPAFVLGNKLWEVCSNESDIPSGLCTFYALGVIDRDAISDHPSFCMPSHVTVGQITDVVKKYLRDHPERRHYTAASVVGAAISVAFPCPVK